MALEMKLNILFEISGPVTNPGKFSYSLSEYIIHSAFILTEHTIRIIIWWTFADGGRIIQVDAAVRQNIPGQHRSRVGRSSWISTTNVAVIYTGISDNLLGISCRWLSYQFCVFQFNRQVLDPRSGWGTLIPAVKLLIGTDEDRLFFIFNGGLHMCFQVRWDVFCSICEPRL